MNTRSAQQRSAGPAEFGYRTPGVRVMFPVLFGGCLIVGILLTVFVLSASDTEFATRSGESNRLGFGVFLIIWIAFGGYVASHWLWRDGTKVVVSDNELTWSSLLRSRVVPLSDVVGNDTSSRQHDVLLLKDNTRPPVLAPDDGWLSFLSFLADVAPDAEFVMTRSTRFRGAGRPGSNGFFVR